MNIIPITPFLLIVACMGFCSSLFALDPKKMCKFFGPLDGTCNEYSSLFPISASFSMVMMLLIVLTGFELQFLKKN
jgi:uncharacterized membrane protein